MTDADQTFLRAVSALNQRDWRQAAELSTQLLALAPHQADCHYIAGVSCLELHQLAAGVQHLRTATEIRPDRADFAAQLARAFSIARMNQDALAAADHARSLQPRDPMTLSVLGNIYASSNAHTLATEMFRQAANLAPDVAHHRYNLATAYVRLGEVAAAESEMEQCLVQDPAFWKAHLALAHLRKQSMENNHLPRLRTLLDQHASDHHAKIALHMALAKELEDVGTYPESFDHLRCGKAESRKNIDYTIAQDEALFDALHRAVPPTGSARAGDASAEPIFVFGMPRTGTTLVERILSSHPDVSSAGELQNFGIALKQAWGTATPLWLDTDIANRARNVDWQKVGAAYIASTRPATGHTPHFIDKLPHNFLYAGFIAHALPNAKMICLRRDPVDTCLSNFRQLFAEKLPYYNYSFNLLDTGKYFVLFDRMLKHWQQLFPGRILEIHYEDLVAGQESATRHLLDFCNLEWNDACLHFEKNPSPVGTASALQVREPLYSSAVKRWKRYEPQLFDLLDVLRQSNIEVAR